MSVFSSSKTFEHIRSHYLPTNNCKIFQNMKDKFFNILLISVGQYSSYLDFTFVILDLRSFIIHLILIYNSVTDICNLQICNL